MNFQYFPYPPPRDSTMVKNDRDQHHQPRSGRQPLRVTPDGIEPLFFALAHTVEYCLSIGKKDTPVSVFTPRITKSERLGGISYVEVERHNASLADGLQKAVRTASALQCRSSSAGAAAPFKLRIRVLRLVVSKGMFSFLAQTTRHVIVEWEFSIIKTKTEVSMAPLYNHNNNNGHHLTASNSHSNPSAGTFASPNMNVTTPSSQFPSSHSSSTTLQQQQQQQQYHHQSGAAGYSSKPIVGGSSGPSPLQQSHLSRSFPSAAAAAAADATGATAGDDISNSSSQLMSAQSIYSNEPSEIRAALQYIIRNAFASIDAEWHKDLRAGDLLYEVDVLDR